MKPILLTIEGLHSFREKQTIDFELLSDAGVFGIFGPTGSGKSTILDALTLALFGTVERAKNRTQGILNHAENSLSVSFQFQIGAGTERKIYRIDRRYERNNEISVRNKYSRLSELDANLEVLAVLSNKDGEVTQLVQEILGLKPEDFARAVVLPQGKFADFLQLNGSERREMLQRLFALERYGVNLSKRLNERHAKTKSSLEVIVAEQNGMGDCSLEALQQAEKLLHEAVAKEQQAIEAFSKVQTEFEAAKQIFYLQQQLIDTIRQMEQHTAADPEIHLLQNKLDRSERAEKVLPFVNRLEETTSKQERHEQERTELEALTALLRTETEAAKSSFAAAQQEHKQKTPELVKRQTQLEEALLLEQEIDALGQKLRELQDHHEQKQDAHTELTAAIKQLTNQYEEAEKELAKQKEIIEQNTVTLEYRMAVQDTVHKQHAFKTAIRELQAKQLEAKRRAKELEDAQSELQDQQAQQQILTAELSVYERKREELANQPLVDEEQLSRDESRLSESKATADYLFRLEEASSSDKKQLVQLEEELQALTASLQQTANQLQAAREQLRDLRHQQQEAVLQDKRAMAVRLAAELNAGEACPVCGSHDHPNPALTAEGSEQDFTELEQLEREIEETDARVSQLADEEAAIRTEIRVKSEKSNDLRQSLTERRGEIESLRLQIQEHLSLEEKKRVSLQLEEHSASQFLATIEAERAHIERKRNEAAAWKLEMRTLEEQIQQVKETISDCLSKVAAAGQKADSARREHEAALLSLQENEKLAKETEHDFLQSLTLIKADSADKAAEELRSKDQQVASAREQEKQLQSQLTARKNELQDKQNLEQHLRIELTELIGTVNDTRQTLTEKQTKWQEITNGTAALDLQQETKRELQRLSETEEAARQDYETKSGQLTDAELRLREAVTRCEEMAIQVETAEKELTSIMCQEHFTISEEVKDAILLPEEKEEWNKRVQEHQDRKQALQNEKDRLENHLDGKAITNEEWLAIQEALELAEQEKKEAISIHGAVKDQYQQLQDKNARWTELETRRQSLAREFSYLEQLKSILKGDKLVEFMAQEQLDFVAKQASDRLKSLTRNRYGLEIGGDGGFIMRDDANGGAKRPVTSLSGGETFLTSLALALSLSTQIQLRGKYPLEFFFLDEGFGTLDGELLEVVLSTLEQLQLEKMTIGIISHVPELQQRLHRRLIVEPAEAAGHGSRVRIERM